MVVITFHALWELEAHQFSQQPCKVGGITAQVQEREEWFFRITPPSDPNPRSQLPVFWLSMS
jgi:hypothetical protein